MSDHCASCAYDVKLRHGEGACPFNPLYWDFFDRHRERLHQNPRLAQVYRTWNLMSEEKRQKVLVSAKKILGDLDANLRI